MDDEPLYTESAAKKARVSLAPSGLATALDSSSTMPPSSRSTTTTTAPSFRPRRRVPPDPRHYLALWHGTSRCGSNGRDADAPSPTSSLSTMLDELDLAQHHQRTWERIGTLLRTIEECEKELDDLRRELDVRTACLPGLLDDDPDCVHYYWHEVLPDQMKHDNGFAWTLLRAAQDPSRLGARSEGSEEEEDEYGQTSALPLPFQRMLWSDEHCPLRDDRQLLLASLDQSLSFHVSILWTNQIENDREILLKIIETCPWGLETDVPEWLNEDVELIRAFARSERLRGYRQKLEWDDVHVVCRFSLDVREDPTMVIELMRQCVESKGSDRWASGMVERHLQRTEWNSDFFLKLVFGFAESMSSVPWKEYQQYCPLQYRDLPSSLKRLRDIVLAFIPVDASVTSEVPDELHNEVELWQAAVQCTPRYKTIQVPAPSPDLPSNLFYLLLLEDAKAPMVDLRKCALPLNAATHNRDFAMKSACLVAHKVEMRLLISRILGDFKSDRDFWIELAEVHRCDLLVWGWAAKPIQADPAVIWAWARHAKKMDPAWLVSKDPGLNLLSDRQVLLNCLPPLWSRDRGRLYVENRQTIWRQIDPAVLDYPLWLDLVSRCKHDGFAELLPTEIKDEPAIVRARLRSTMDDASSFVHLFCRTLSPDVRLEHLDFLLQMIQGIDNKEFFVSDVYDALDLSLLDVPEVALALLSKGWCIEHDGFKHAVSLAPWRNDPDFVLQIAERQLISAFRGCCRDIVTSKEFLLKVVQRDTRLWDFLDEVDDEDEMDGVHFKYDFDVLMCVLGTSPDIILSQVPSLDSDSRRESAVPTKSIVAFAREVRHRLILHASIETVMMGTRSQDDAFASAPASCHETTPLSLLDQDRYTKSDFRSRLAALLGAPPSDDDDVASLRRISNALSRYGF